LRAPILSLSKYQSCELSGKLGIFLDDRRTGGMITILPALCSGSVFAAGRRWNSSLSPCDIS
jgi:hypothetical protein